MIPGSTPLGTAPLASYWSFGPLGISGTLTATLGALTGSGAGSLPIGGTGAATLGALTLSGTGALRIAGAAGVTLGALTGTGSGSLPIGGTGAATLGALTLSGAGALRIAAAAGVTLGAVTASGSGGSGIGGAGAATLGTLTLFATGTIADQVPATVIRLLTFNADQKNLTFNADQKNLTFQGTFDGVPNMKRLPNKTPSERWKVKLNIPSWMGVDYTPLSATHTIVSGDVEVSEVTLLSDHLTFIVEAGTAGESRIRINVTFDEADQVFTEDFAVTVV